MRILKYQVSVFKKYKNNQFQIFGNWKLRTENSQTGLPLEALAKWGGLCQC